ncbi:MAG: hypothetical protein IJ574_00220 [Bacilli bacterium]|nr:hypothetical protein [Bacilli bacterium]
MSIFYSYGLKRGTDHYQDDHEILVNIETLDEENIYNIKKDDLILIGRFLLNGDYDSPYPSINEIRSMYYELIRQGKDNVNNELIKRYGATKYTDNKYIFNNPLILENLTTDNEIRIYDYFNEYRKRKVLRK